MTWPSWSTSSSQPTSSAETASFSTINCLVAIVKHKRRHKVFDNRRSELRVWRHGNPYSGRQAIAAANRHRAIAISAARCGISFADPLHSASVPKERDRIEQGEQGEQGDQGEQRQRRALQLTGAVTSCSHHKAHATVVSGTGGAVGNADLFRLIFASGVHASVGSGCGSIATIGADQSGSSSAAPGSSSPATDESGASKGGVASGSEAVIARASVDQADASVSANSNL